MKRCTRSTGFWTLSILPRFTAIIMLWLPLIGNLPGWYFDLLRWYVTLLLLHWLINQFDPRVTEWRPFWRLTYLTLALLFNPLLPIHMQRDLWHLLDFMAALLIYTSLFFCSHRLFHNVPNRRGRPAKGWAMSRWLYWLTGLMFLWVGMRQIGHWFFGLKLDEL